MNRSNENIILESNGFLHNKQQNADDYKVTEVISLFMKEAFLIHDDEICILWILVAIV
jgi:hypothetical protein